MRIVENKNKSESFHMILSGVLGGIAGAFISSSMLMMNVYTPFDLVMILFVFFGLLWIFAYGFYWTYDKFF